MVEKISLSEIARKKIRRSAATVGAAGVVAIPMAAVPSAAHAESPANGSPAHVQVVKDVRTGGVDFDAKRIHLTGVKPSYCVIPEPRQEPEKPEKIDEKLFDVYTVKKGDTLSEIAADSLKQKEGQQFDWKKTQEDFMLTAAASGIANPDLIYPGQKIHIPGKELRQTVRDAQQGNGKKEVVDTVKALTQEITHRGYHKADNEALNVLTAVSEIQQQNPPKEPTGLAADKSLLEIATELNIAPINISTPFRSDVVESQTKIALANQCIVGTEAKSQTTIREQLTRKGDTKSDTYLRARMAEAATSYDISKYNHNSRDIQMQKGEKFNKLSGGVESVLQGISSMSLRDMMDLKSLRDQKKFPDDVYTEVATLWAVAASKDIGMILSENDHHTLRNAAYGHLVEALSRNDRRQEPDDTKKLITLLNKAKTPEERAQLMLDHPNALKHFFRDDAQGAVPPLNPPAVDISPKDPPKDEGNALLAYGKEHAGWIAGALGLLALGAVGVKKRKEIKEKLMHKKYKDEKVQESLALRKAEKKHLTDDEIREQIRLIYPKTMTWKQESKLRLNTNKGRLDVLPNETSVGMDEASFRKFLEFVKENPDSVYCKAALDEYESHKKAGTEDKYAFVASARTRLATNLEDVKLSIEDRDVTKRPLGYVSFEWRLVEVIDPASLPPQPPAPKRKPRRTPTSPEPQGGTTPPVTPEPQGGATPPAQPEPKGGTKPPEK